MTEREPQRYEHLPRLRTRTDPTFCQPTEWGDLMRERSAPLSLIERVKGSVFLILGVICAGLLLLTGISMLFLLVRGLLHLYGVVER